MRWLVCGCLALLLVCAPGVTGSTHAGKKRRDPSLDRLRERNPSERWKLLQKLWQPDAEDAAADSVPAGAGDTPAEVIPVPQVPPAEPPVRLPQEAASSARDAKSPVWVFDAATDADSQALKRSGSRLQEVNLQANQTQAPPERQLERRINDAITLKPITDIVPYHNYIPPGTPNADRLQCSEDDQGTNCPILRELPDVEFDERVFAESYVTWEASNLFSNPLYFEDAPLERYGHTCGVIQPVVSLGKFGAQLVGLPYQMALHPIHERRYALGWYRPGECAPYKCYLPPWNTKAALTAGAVYTGLFFVIP